MTDSEMLEVERKYDVGEDDELPVLESLPGVDRVGPPEDEALDAVYFDTAGLALASRGITLRRRTGGHDDGWHLKLPVAVGERQEFTRAAGQGSGVGAPAAAATRPGPHEGSGRDSGGEAEDPAHHAAPLCVRWNRPGRLQR